MSKESQGRKVRKARLERKAHKEYLGRKAHQEQDQEGERARVRRSGYEPGVLVIIHQVVKRHYGHA